MIHIGTSGFSYEDWKGRFYPESVARRDMLAYYAGRFSAVEINSSYYAIPGAASFEAMHRKTPDGFRFAIKAHKEMTHVEKPESDVFDRFLGSIQPLSDAGKLGCVLAQFPWSFRQSAANVSRLRELRDRMGDVPTVVEFRNAEWVNDDTLSLLRELGLGFCSVDEPRLKGLMPPVAETTSDIGYVRFHGRNAARWWRHEEAYERYDYLYNEDELSEWVPRVEDIVTRARETYVFFNNHYQGKSAENARMFARMLGLHLEKGAGASGGQMTFGDDFRYEPG